MVFVVGHQTRVGFWRRLLPCDSNLGFEENSGTRGGFLFFFLAGYRLSRHLSVSFNQEFQDHKAGILAISWCPHESSLLLSCGKDNRTLCWDTDSGKVLCELDSCDEWVYNVQWSPRVPAILSTSSFDGKVRRSRHTSTSTV